MTGGYGGLGLEAALALAEAGARAVYCLGRASVPPEKWLKVKDYAAKMASKASVGRLEYICADVADQVRSYRGFDTLQNILRSLNNLGQDVEDF